MKIKIEKLIKDLKNSVRENVRIGTKCEICQQDMDQFNIPADYCKNCGIADCKSFSKKYRTYQLCAGWYTDSWLEHAFNDIGAYLQPQDYGFEDYYSDEILEEENKKLNGAMELFCKQFDD
jgi:hypothetical protein